MNTIRVPAKNNKCTDYINVLAVFPVIFVLAFVPLIVRLKIVDSNMVGSTYSYDFFSYWKVSALYTAGVIAVILSFWLIKKGEHSFNKGVKVFTILSVIYTLMCFISAVFSEQHKIAFFGFQCQQEGFLTLLAVNIVSVYAAFFINNEKRRVMTINALYISSIVVFLIGILQFAGFNIINSDLIKSFILPSQYQSLANDIVFYDASPSSFRNAIYSTLYNSNVFGTYAAILFGLSLADSIYRFGFKKKALPLTVMSMAIFTLIGCYSRGAYLGGAVAAVTVVILSFKRIRMNLKETAVCIGCLALAVILAVFSGGGRVFDRLATMDISYQDTVTGVNARINDFKVNGNLLSVYFNENELVIEKAGETLNFKDEEGNLLSLDYSEKDAGYVINSEKYKGFIVFASDDKLYIKKQNVLLNFIIKADSFILADFTGNPADIKEPEAIFFEGKERLASGRGYIWSRTIPLIKNTLFWGWGPDNFYYAFPQNDYMGKLKFMHSAYIPVDMAHNMYLQIAIETGIISLVIFMVLILLFVITMIRTVFSKSLGQESTWISVAAVAVTAAYMVCGIFTDANAITMMIFLPLVGICCNICDVKNNTTQE